MSKFIVIDTLSGFTCAVEIGPNHRDTIASFGNSFAAMHGLAAMVGTYMNDDGFSVVIDIQDARKMHDFYRVVTSRIAEECDNSEGMFALQRKLEKLMPALEA